MAKTKKQSKKVTNLTVKRAGKKYTVEWNNPVTWSTLKVKHRRKVNGSWKDWSDYTTLSTSATKHEWTDTNSYYPGSGSPSGDKLDSVEFLVYSCQADTSKINYTYNYDTAYFSINPPKAPKITVTPNAATTSFKYSVDKAGNDTHYPFTKIGYGTAHANNYQDPASHSGWSSAVYDTDAEDTKTEEIGWSDIPAGGSKTSMIRVKAYGWGGKNDNYTYAKYVYGFPYKAKNITKASWSDISGGHNVGIKWDKSSDASHPSKEYKVQYYIGSPANTSLDCPTNVSWETAQDYTANASTTQQQCVFKTGVRVQAEECMWVRVWQKCVGTLETVSNNYRIYQFSSLPKPTIGAITYDAVSHAFSVNVTTNCTLGVTTYVYLNGGTAFTVSSGTASGTKDLGTGKCTVTAVNYYGSIKSDSVTANYYPTTSATSPTNFYPTNVKANQVDNAGNVKVTWDNVMGGVTSAEVTVATDPTEWSKSNPSFFDTITVTAAGAKEATVGGLAFNSTYYFKVRTTNAQGTTTYSASTGSITPSAAKAPSPNITLTETSTHAIQVAWSWNTWSSATGIQLLWSKDAQANSNPNASWTSVSRDGRTGNWTYIIPDLERGNFPWYVWARFVSGAAVTSASRTYIMLAINPVAPTNTSFVREAQSSDENGKTTARISWTNNWADTQKVVLTWDTSASAWNTTSGASHSAELSASQNTTLISGLDLGTIWYAKVRLVYNDTYYAESNIMSLDLNTVPYTPVVALSSDVTTQYGKIDVSWTYGNEDGSEQASAAVNIYNSSKTLLKTVPCVSNETSVAVYSETYGLTGDNDYYVTVQTTSANNVSSAISEYVLFTVINKPIAEITSTSLVDVVIDEGEETEHTIHTLQTMPLTVTVSGAENGGHIILYIEHAKAQYLARPDEGILHGNEGDLIVVAEGDSPIVIEQADLRTTFDENNDYTITAIVADKRGVQSDPVTLDFTVMWAEHAVMPTATYVVDETNRVVKITPTAGQDTPNDATFEIYRLSADKPQLIVSSADWGTTFVDPYPALGEYGGHRIVCKTATGDYTTAEGMLAWLDIEGETLEADGKAVIDFSGAQIDFVYNVDVSHTWNKDFTETKYLGGSVQGDWNAAVSRKTTLSSVMITLVDAGKIELMRRLAVHAGICHVRTPDGSSFPADVQVSETWSHDKRYKVVEFSMDITRVDSEMLEGVTLAEWEAQ